MPQSAENKYTASGSTRLVFIIGLVGLAAAIATGSGAILLDGGFNLVYFATALVTLRVARLVERSDDHR